jgi:hypothetical protein
MRFQHSSIEQIHNCIESVVIGDHKLKARQTNASGTTQSCPTLILFLKLLFKKCICNNI